MAETAPKAIDESGWKPALGGRRERIARRARLRAALLGRAAIPLWPLLLPLLFLAKAFGGAPYPPAGGEYSDLTISHFPNALFLLQALSKWGTLPLWSPTILSGYPFFADPLSGLWYPPGWLVLLLPLPWGFSVLLGLHLLWGGLGMYSLLRAEGSSRPAALLGALSFEAMPKLFAHLGAGHVSLFYAVAWTPWLLLPAARESRRTVDAPGARPAGGAWEAVVLAAIALADVRWSLPALALWAGYRLARRQRKPARAVLRGLLGKTFLAGLLAAPLLAPLLEYTRLSSRAGLSPGESLVLSLPLERLLGLVFPDLGGPHEWALYPGAIALALAACAALLAGRTARGSFWLAAALVTLLFSLGENLPGLSGLIYALGFGLLRVPTRWLFLFGMCLAALAAQGFERLRSDLGPGERRRARLATFALAALALALTLGAWAAAGELPLEIAWGGLAVSGAALTLAVRLRSNAGPASRAWLAGLFALALLDLGGVDLQAYSVRPLRAVMAEGAEAAAYLAAQPGRFRVYSPSYSLPQHTAVAYGLELASGSDPLHLEAYAAFVERAGGVPRSEYSVTVPSFETGTPRQDNAAFRPEARLLGLLNVRYVAAEYDLQGEGLALRARFGDTRLYENLHALPRAWVQPSGAPPGWEARPVEALEWAPNRLEVQAQGPGRLVLSEIDYPGWQAWVDGERRPIAALAGLLRAVDLEDGAQRVVFVFRPLSLYLGLALSLVGALWLLAVLPGWRRRPGEEPGR